jgi:hypothetical protein
MPISSLDSSSNGRQPGETSGKPQISAEMIRKVTEQVWLLWQAELKIEDERRGKGNRLGNWKRYGGN